MEVVRWYRCKLITRRRYRKYARCTSVAHFYVGWVLTEGFTLGVVVGQEPGQLIVVGVAFVEHD